MSTPPLLTLHSLTPTNRQTLHLSLPLSLISPTLRTLDQQIPIVLCILVYEPRVSIMVLNPNIPFTVPTNPYICLFQVRW